MRMENTSRLLPKQEWRHKNYRLSLRLVKPLLRSILPNKPPSLQQPHLLNSLNKK